MVTWNQAPAMSSAVWKYKRLTVYWLWPLKREHSAEGGGEKCVEPCTYKVKKGEHVFPICLGMGKKNFSFHLILVQTNRETALFVNPPNVSYCSPARLGSAGIGLPSQDATAFLT